MAQKATPTTQRHDTVIFGPKQQPLVVSQQGVAFDAQQPARPTTQTVHSTKTVLPPSLPASGGHESTRVLTPPAAPLDHTHRLESYSPVTEPEKAAQSVCNAVQANHKLLTRVQTALTALAKSVHPPLCAEQPLGILWIGGGTVRDAIQAHEELNFTPEKDIDFDLVPLGGVDLIKAAQHAGPARGQSPHRFTPLSPNAGLFRERLAYGQEAPTPDDIPFDIRIRANNEHKERFWVFRHHAGLVPFAVILADGSMQRVRPDGIYFPNSEKPSDDKQSMYKAIKEDLRYHRAYTATAAGIDRLKMGKVLIAMGRGHEIPHETRDAFMEAWIRDTAAIPMPESGMPDDIQWGDFLKKQEGKHHVPGLRLLFVEAFIDWGRRHAEDPTLKALWERCHRRCQNDLDIFIPLTQWNPENKQSSDLTRYHHADKPITQLPIETLMALFMHETTPSEVAFGILPTDAPLARGVLLQPSWGPDALRDVIAQLNIERPQDLPHFLVHLLTQSNDERLKDVIIDHLSHCAPPQLQQTLTQKRYIIAPLLLGKLIQQRAYDEGSVFIAQALAKRVEADHGAARTMVGPLIEKFMGENRPDIAAPLVLVSQKSVTPENACLWFLKIVSQSDAYHQTYFQPLCKILVSRARGDSWPQHCARLLWEAQGNPLLSETARHFTHIITPDDFRTNKAPKSVWDAFAKLLSVDAIPADKPPRDCVSVPKAFLTHPEVHAELPSSLERVLAICWRRAHPTWKPINPVTVEVPKPGKAKADNPAPAAKNLKKDKEKTTQSSTTKPPSISARDEAILAKAIADNARMLEAKWRKDISKIDESQFLKATREEAPHAVALLRAHQETSPELVYQKALALLESCIPEPGKIMVAPEIVRDIVSIITKEEQQLLRFPFKEKAITRLCVAIARSKAKDKSAIAVCEIILCKAIGSLTDCVKNSSLSLPQVVIIISNIHLSDALKALPPSELLRHALNTLIIGVSTAHPKTAHLQPRAVMDRILTPLGKAWVEAYEHIKQPLEKFDEFGFNHVYVRLLSMDPSDATLWILNHTYFSEIRRQCGESIPGISPEAERQLVINTPLVALNLGTLIGAFLRVVPQGSDLHTAVVRLLQNPENIINDNPHFELSKAATATLVGHMMAGLLSTDHLPWMIFDLPEVDEPCPPMHSASIILNKITPWLKHRAQFDAVDQDHVMRENIESILKIAMDLLEQTGGYQKIHFSQKLVAFLAQSIPFLEQINTSFDHILAWTKKVSTCIDPTSLHVPFHEQFANDCIPYVVDDQSCTTSGRLVQALKSSAGIEEQPADITKPDSLLESLFRAPTPWDNRIEHLHMRVMAHAESDPAWSPHQSLLDFVFRPAHDALPHSTPCKIMLLQRFIAVDEMHVYQVLAYQAPTLSAAHPPYALTTEQAQDAHERIDEVIRAANPLDMEEILNACDWQAALRRMRESIPHHGTNASVFQSEIHPEPMTTDFYFVHEESVETMLRAFAWIEAHPEQPREKRLAIATLMASHLKKQEHKDPEIGQIIGRLINIIVAQAETYPAALQKEIFDEIVAPLLVRT